MKRLIEIFKDNGLQKGDYDCLGFDGIFESDRMIFAIKNFTNKQDLKNWASLQDEVNLKIYSMVDYARKTDIYFILFISFKTVSEDVFILHKIEKDAFYCRKIVIRKEYFERDIKKLPFLPFDKFEESEKVRARTIREFVNEITSSFSEKKLIEKIFELQDKKIIAKQFINYKGIGSDDSSET